MVGCVGDDDFGARLLAALAAEGVESGVRTVPGVPTGLAMITIDGVGENIITVAPGANREVGGPEIAAVAAAPADMLVISAEIPVAAIRAALAAGTLAPGTPAAGTPPVRVLNLAPAPPEAVDLVGSGVDWLVVNEAEAAAVLGRPVAGLAGAARAAVDLARVGARNAVVTAGAAGAAYCGQDPAGVLTVPAFRVDAVDTVGAGDTFVGALAVALAAGSAPAGAVRAAAAAAAAAAARPGTQSGMPRPADVLSLTGHPWPVRAS
jgi:ribokinase